MKGNQGFVAAGLVALIVLACYHQQNSEGVWRIAFGLGIAVSHCSTMEISRFQGPSR
jgi:hypothetical protein